MKLLATSVTTAVLLPARAEMKLIMDVVARRLLQPTMTGEFGHSIRQGTLLIFFVFR